MTIEKLLNLSPAELEAMTEAELEKHCEPFLPYTRPELVQQTVEYQKSEHKRVTTVKDSKQSKAMAILEQFGLKGILEK